MVRWRHRVRIPLLVLLGLNLVVGAFTFHRVQAVRSVAARREALVARVAQARIDLDEARERSRLLAANEAGTTRFLTAVATDRRVTLVPLLQELAALATRHGLRPRSQSHQFARVPGLPVTRFTVTLPVRGRYADVAGYVAGLEGSPQFLTIDSLRIARGAEGADLAVAVSTFFRAEPEDEE